MQLITQIQVCILFTNAKFNQYSPFLAQCASIRRVTQEFLRASCTVLSVTYIQALWFPLFLSLQIPRRKL